MSRGRRTTRAVLVFLAALALLALTLVSVDDALARPGGGHSYSGGGGGRSGGGGGGGGGSSGSGDGGGQLLVWLIQLTFEYPKVMLPLWGVVGFVFWLAKRGGRGEEWTAAGSSGGLSALAGREKLLPRQELERLREADPQFSVVVFEDFLQALYARVHEARGAHTLVALAPYLAPDLRARLEEEAVALAAVEAVIVGAMSYASVSVPAEPDGRVRVVVDFEANYTEVSSSPRHEKSGWYVAERWTLSRPKAARSRPPDQVRSFGCPSCGAPLTGLRDDVCAHCGKLVTSGEFDWRVDAIAGRTRERRGPQLTTAAVEVGTLTPTIVDPEAERRRSELKARDPQFAWDTFTARVHHIFAEIQVAWSTPDLKRARPYISDNLYQTWAYWIVAYRAAGLRNVTEASRVLGLRLARVTSDAYYDAITIRLRAVGLDYTVNTSGEIVSGSNSEPREYGEYWTLIRGTLTQGVARSDARCPRCGAPLAVNMAGQCEYCSAHVVSGEFDWVLGRIEQDESYQG